MYCSKCGTKLPENSRFCTKCGSPALDAVPQGAGISAGNVDTLQKSAGIMRFMPLILALLCIASAVIFIQFREPFKSDEEKAKQIVTDFFESVQAGDTSGAIKCFTPAFQEQYGGVLKASGIILNTFKLPDVTGLVNPFLGAMDQYAYRDYEFRVKEPVLSADKENGTVDVDVYVGGEYNGTTTIKVTKYRGDWYVEN